MEEKIIRFLELSKKFSKTEDEAIGKEMSVLDRYKSIGWVYSNHPSLDDIISSGAVTSTVVEPNTETIEDLAERMVTRIKEFQEYKQLQKDLIEYYRAKQKLN